MNALVSIDIATLTPQTVFAPGGMEGIVAKLEAEVRAVDRDISTPEGREAIKSLAYKVARSKTALDDMGKELVAGIKKQAGAIDADRKLARDRLDALKEEVRDPLTAWETAEADRVALHESALTFLAESARFSTPPSAATIRERVASVREACSRDWQEFGARADVLAAESGAALATMLVAAEQAERDAAELAELRRQAAERAEADRIAAEAKAQAERAAQDAEAFAASERIRAEQQAERDRQQAERAVRQAEEAAARAVEQERQRVAAKEATEKAAQEKREANKRHRTKVHSEITLALSEILTGNADEAAFLIEAIAAGRVPHISITY